MNEPASEHVLWTQPGIDKLPDWNDPELTRLPMMALFTKVVGHRHGASADTLVRRAQYGGRKGRSAMRRLRRHEWAGPISRSARWVEGRGWKWIRPLESGISICMTMTQVWIADERQDSEADLRGEVSES